MRPCLHLFAFVEVLVSASASLEHYFISAWLILHFNTNQTSAKAIGLQPRVRFAPIIALYNTLVVDRYLPSATRHFQAAPQSNSLIPSLRLT